MLLVDYYTIKILNISDMTKHIQTYTGIGRRTFPEQKGNGKETA